MPTTNPDLPADGDDAIVAPYNAAIQAILNVINGNVDQDNLKDGGVLLTKLATAVQQALVPIGAIVPYGGAAAPSSGWLLCYGQAVSRSTYADLFATVGTVFGTGDGSTTFNLPDMRGRVPAGQDDMGGTSANRLTNPASTTGGIDGDVLGGTGGSETHAITQGQSAYIRSGDEVASYGLTNATPGFTNRAAVSRTSDAAGAAHNNVQPTIITNYIIKV